MTFKTNLPAAACPSLSGYDVLAVEGRDAGAFLQAQAMNDVLALAPGQWQWNGWLTPKGRVVALFALLRAGPDRYLMVLPDFPAAQLQPQLQRFVFRSKLTLDAATGLVAAVGPALAFAAPDRAVDFDDGWAMDLGGDGGPRTLFLLPHGSEALAPVNPAVDASWFAADLAHGLPRLPESQREAWTPQMLSLDRLAAYSLKKGCYPGQEIVARTHYLGQAKRELARLAGTGLEPGLAVEAEGKPVGTVVCVDTEGRDALAVLTAGAEGILTVGGRDCTRPALLAGLARAG